MFKEYQIFTKDECKRIVSDIYELQDSWIQRDDEFEMPFFSLGIAAYLDAFEDFEQYSQFAQRFNKILEHKFDWMYSKLKTAINEVTGCEAYYDPDLALPGFHIFIGDILYEEALAALHCDIQEEFIKWHKKTISDPISFTVAVELPRHGSGLYTWEAYHDDIAYFSEDQREAFISQKEKIFHPYTIGELIIHSGKMFHQIAPIEEVHQDDKRITLQGHGVKIDGKYCLYW